MHLRAELKKILPEDLRLSSRGTRSMHEKSDEHKGHRPVIVKRTVIGSKGGFEAQHNIFKL